MGFHDVMGTLYSRRGMRLGGVPTGSFLLVTRDLEAKRPGVREEIIAEAHWNIMFYTSAIPELTFVGIMNWANSLAIATGGFIFALLLSLMLFHLLATNKPFGWIACIWSFVSFPIVLLMAYRYGTAGELIPMAAMIGFCVFQLYLRIPTALVKAVFEMATATLRVRREAAADGLFSIPVPMEHTAVTFATSRRASWPWANRVELGLRRFVPIVYGLLAISIAVWLVMWFSGWWRYIPGGVFLVLGLFFAWWGCYVRRW